LFAALSFLNLNIEIHLRGVVARGCDHWLTRLLPESYRSRVFVHPPVRNAELLSRIAEHDIGFAGEPKSPLSRDVTVTNKILQYLLAGLAVIASDTAGQREIADQATGAITIYPAGDSRALAGVVRGLVLSPERLAAGKQDALSAAKRRFSWELIEPELIGSFRKALG
jgi:glycosyltransferase involved in cell wall biosynthesis